MRLFAKKRIVICIPVCYSVRAWRPKPICLKHIVLIKARRVQLHLVFSALVGCVCLAACVCLLGTNKKEFSSADGPLTYSYNTHGTKMNERGFVHFCAYVYMAKWVSLLQKNTLRPKLFGREKWTKTKNEKNTDYSTTDRRKMII